MWLVLGVIICSKQLYFQCWSGIHALDGIGVAIPGMKDVFWKNGRTNGQ